MGYLAIVLFIFIVEGMFRPRLDFTRDKKLLLWYGRHSRNYIEVFNF